MTVPMMDQPLRQPMSVFLWGLAARTVRTYMDSFCIICFPICFKILLRFFLPAFSLLLTRSLSVLFNFCLKPPLFLSPFLLSPSLLLLFSSIRPHLQHLISFFSRQGSVRHCYSGRQLFLHRKGCHVGQSCV